MANADRFRIGELSRRVGVTQHTLRAWESRYDLLQPARSEGGFRLYSSTDEQRVRRMVDLLQRGMSAAEAARGVLDEGVPIATAAADAEVVDAFLGARGRLAKALNGFIDHDAHLVIDRALADFSLETVLRQLIVPFLAEQDARWEDGTINLLQEHFARNVLRGRLAGLARGWATGVGRRAVVACPTGELRDLRAMVFGITLHHHGWRVIFLGANTPITRLDQVIDPPPDLVFLAADTPGVFREIRDDLADLAHRRPVIIAGIAATQQLAEATGAILATEDPVSLAEAVARGDILD